MTSFLRETTIPVRLASHGRYPLVQSLWYLFDEGSLWCATQEDSVLARRLARSERCGFEVSGDLPPYRGVRGTGTASLDRAAAGRVLPQLIHRYLGDQSTPLGDWLLARIETEVAIRISGLAVTSWDFSARMAPPDA